MIDGVRGSAVALLAVFVLLSVACSSGGPLRSGSGAELSSSPAEFLNGFETAVGARDWVAARRYLDPAYVSEQHDEMLSGRTDQFFVELLGIYKQCKGISHRVCLGRIRGMRRLRTPGPAAGAGVPVRFLIKLDGESQPVSFTLHLKLGPAPRKFSLIGPVG